MDQNNNISPDQTPTPPDVAVDQPIQVEPISVTTEPIKKSRKELYISIIAIAIVIAAVAGYLVYSYSQPTTKTDNTVTTDSNTQIKASSNPDIESITSILTDGSSSESLLNSTDDSQIVTDASNTAGVVGDSINENDF